MKLVAEKSAMVDALSFVCAYAAKDNRIPILASVLISADSDGVTVSTTNADRAARGRFVAAVERPASLCLPAAMLLSAVRNSTGTEVSIDADDKRAVIKCGKQRFTLPILPATDFPPLPMLDGTDGAQIELDGALLTRIAKQVSFAAEDAKGRYYLAGTSWRAGSGKIEFCATDGKRLSMISVEAHADLDIIVPIFDLPDWDGPISVLATERSIRLQHGDRIVASKLVEGTYPNIHRILPQGGRSLLFDRAELLAGIKRVSLIADAKDHSILLTGREGTATLAGATAEREAVDEVAYEGDDFQIAFLNTVISSVLASFDCEMIEVRFTDHASPIIVCDPRDENRLGFAMPYADRRVMEHVAPTLQAAE